MIRGMGSGPNWTAKRGFLLGAGISIAVVAVIAVIVAIVQAQT